MKFTVINTEKYLPLLTTHITLSTFFPWREDGYEFNPLQDLWKKLKLNKGGIYNILIQKIKLFLTVAQSKFQYGGLQLLDNQ
jgi:hypothetical protein